MHIAVAVIGCGPTGLRLSGALARRGHRAIAADRGCSSIVEDGPLRLLHLRMYSWQRLDLDHTAPTTRCPPALGREGPRGSLSAAATGARVPMPRRGSAVPSPGAPTDPCRSAAQLASVSSWVNVNSRWFLSIMPAASTSPAASARA